MTEEKKLPVTVLSRNYSTGLGIIRSLGAAGFTVDLVASVKKSGSSIIAASSRYVRSNTEVKLSALQEDKGETLLEKLIELGCTREMSVLFPADDFTASVMDRFRDRLEQYYIMPYVENGKPGDMLHLMDKNVQAGFAREAGLLTPREWAVSLRGEIEIPEDMVYPCFVKPLESVTGYKTEMARCDSAEELDSHLAEMQRFYRDREVLVQEFLNIDREYDFSGVCLNQEIIIPAIIEKTHIAQHERGVTMAGRLINPDILGPELEKVKTMLRLFRYTGMFDMEFNLCGDKLYFNEVNLRSGGPNYSYFLNGANLPALLVDELLEGKHDSGDEDVREFGKSFVYEKTAWEEYINGCISRKERDEAIADADYTLLADENDPQPGKVFFAKIRLSTMKRRVLGTIRKHN